MVCSDRCQKEECIFGKLLPKLGTSADRTWANCPRATSAFQPILTSSSSGNGQAGRDGDSCLFPDKLAPITGSMVFMVYNVHTGKPTFLVFPLNAIARIFSFNHCPVIYLCQLFKTRNQR